MQSFLDKQFAFDTYLPGTPHPVSDLTDLFPYHIWGKGAIPNVSAGETKEREQLRLQESVRRRSTPQCVEEACAYGNLQYLVLLYAQGRLDVLARRAVYEGSDASPLMWAAFKGHLPIVKFLIDMAKRECVEMTTETTTTDADTDNNDIGDNSGGMFGLTGNNGNEKNKKPDPAAVITARLEAFDKFINYSSALGHTALQWAIISGHLAIARLLLDNNASAAHRDRQGFDAAFVAVQNDQFPMLLMLLEDGIVARGVTLSGHNNAATDGPTTTDGAAIAAEVEVHMGVNGAEEDDGEDDDDEKEDDDDDASYEARAYRVNSDRLDSLNDKTAAINAIIIMMANNNSSGGGGDFFFPVARYNYYRLSPLLRDVEGHSLLHWAAYRNSPATCAHLLRQWGYDADLRDRHGRTPMIWAAREGFAEVVELLCLHGANRDLADNEGITPRQYTKLRNHPEAARVLETAPRVSISALYASTLSTTTGNAVDDDSSISNDVAAARKQLAAYQSVRARRNYGTLLMMWQEPVFAAQAAVGAVYMFLSYALLAIAPPVFSYFPFGVYFFKNMLWTILVRRPEQSSKSEKTDVGKDAGLAATLAESVRGTWRFRLREPANLFCVVVMMALQLFCWTQLGLTPFAHSFFSFDFLFRPFSAAGRNPSAVSLADSPLYRGGDGVHAACMTSVPPYYFESTAYSNGNGGPDKITLAVLHCGMQRLAAHVEAHKTFYSSDRRCTSFVGSGTNIIAEIDDVALLAWPQYSHNLLPPLVGSSNNDDNREGSSGYVSSAEALLSARSYLGGGTPLGWVFGWDAPSMVGHVLPLLFTLTVVFFVATKLLAGRSAMTFRAINDDFKKSGSGSSSARTAKSGGGGGKTRRGGGGGGGMFTRLRTNSSSSRNKNNAASSPYTTEGTLRTSPLWRILRARAYGWLTAAGPRAVMAQRHTQLPCRAFYCAERDVIVRRFDGYSILLDCPIGRSNRLVFVLGLTCFTLMQVCLFSWGRQQLDFFAGTLSGTRNTREWWGAGALDGANASTSSPVALRASVVDRNADVAKALASIHQKPRYQNLKQNEAARDMDERAPLNFDWLGSLASYFIHGLPRRQTLYIQNRLVIPMLASAGVAVAPDDVGTTEEDRLRRGWERGALMELEWPLAHKPDNPTGEEEDGGASPTISLPRALLFAFYYYWWPTRANLCGAFMIHFSFYAMLMGAALTARQWSAVWRGATRMELSNPVTPCQEYGGRLVSIFPLSQLLILPGGGGGETTVPSFEYNINIDNGNDNDGAGNRRDDNDNDQGYSGGGGGVNISISSSGGAAAAVVSGGVEEGSPAAQLCNVNLDEEHFYEHTNPSKARRVRPEGPGLLTKSLYADSQWAIVNVLAFLVGRDGARWDGAMAVSDSMKPIKAPLVPELLN